MATRYQRGNQNLYIEGHAMLWSNEKEQAKGERKSDLQNTTQNNKDWATTTPEKCLVFRKCGYI
jgi:hypothetical protein